MVVAAGVLVQPHSLPMITHSSPSGHSPKMQVGTVSSAHAACALASGKQVNTPTAINSAQMDRLILISPTLRDDLALVS